MASTLAERFFERFAPLMRAYGRYHINKSAIKSVKPGQKLEGGGDTVHSAPNAGLWEHHLAGKIQLGLVPIRDDSTCTWGAIDIDDYSIDHIALEEKVNNLGLPLLVCRTKSGGAHLYCFTSEPVAAEIMRGKLMEWTVSLGVSGAEIFPKQTRLAGDKDYGSWINVPYCGGEDTVRYCIHKGEKIGPEDFLDLIDDTYGVDEEKLRAISAPLAEEIENLLNEGPPCLQTIMSRGKVSELRNQTIFNIIVYLRKVHGDDFKEEMIDEYNQSFFDPPIGHKELAHLLKSTGKKQYNYKCNDEPIRSCCNRQICLTRKWGVGGGDGDPGVVFGTLVKLNSDPPYWIWDVNGARLELTTEELQNQARFQRRCIETINIWPQTIKNKQWQEIVRQRLTAVEVREVPKDASLEGQIMAYLEAYCTSRVMARSREELTLKRPWASPEDGRTYFHGPDFIKYLQQQRVQVQARQVWAWLTKIGADHHGFNINGSFINLWSVKSFAQQSVEYPVPEIPEEM